MHISINALSNQNSSKIGDQEKTDSFFESCLCSRYWRLARLVVWLAASLVIMMVQPVFTHAQGISTGDGKWVWQTPLPQGYTLNDMWGTDANNIWAVGEAGTIIKWNGNGWSLQNSGTTRNLSRVWGVDANNIWAVGSDGTILMWNGSSWSAQSSGTSQSLYGVWGADANNIWVVGNTGTIQKWNGSSWSAQSSGTTNHLYGVWGTDANNLWTVGWNGTILNWNGSNWITQSTGTTDALYSVWGTNTNNVWAVGWDGTILKWNGSGWSTQSSGTTNYIYRVWGADVNNVWAVGWNGTILKWNGSGWSTQSSGTTDYLHGVWGTDVDNIWVVGNAGIILKWKVNSWSPQNSNTTNHINGVWGTDANNIWAVGIDGAILRWNGISWSTQNSGTPQLLNGVWGTDNNNVWVVGNAGTILKWNGSSWSAQSSGTTNNLQRVWGIDANNVWAVGWSGTVLKWNGSSWIAQSSGATDHIYSVWGADANNIWTVGIYGTILKWNGSSWSTQNSGTTNDLYQVWGADANNVWATGWGGTILKWNGSSWNTQSSGTVDYLRSVWGTDANSAWVVGWGGTILKWNGGTWRAQNSGTANVLHDLWGDAVNSVWAVGENGTILRNAPSMLIPGMATWTRLADGPFTPRGGMGLAYDAAHSQLVMYGGSCSTYACGDTWVHDINTGWHQLAIGGPSAREDLVMVYDDNRGRIVLFGGHVWAGAHLNDTWEFNGSSWSHITTTTNPPGRSNQGMAYDPERQRVVIFGGWRDTQAGNDILNDTWEYDGSNWAQVPTANTPTRRGGARLVYAPTLGKIVMFGGLTSDLPLLQDTWVFDGANWTEITTQHAPSPRWDYQLTYDPVRQRVVLFGGRTAPYIGSVSLNDTWEFDGVDWTQITTQGEPPLAWDAVMVRDPSQNGIILVGGISTNQGNVHNWVWRYTPASTLGASIQLANYTNGEDADTIPGPVVKPGDIVTWTYRITNTGTITLTDITLTDDRQGGVICPVTQLTPSSSTICTLTGTAIAGQYTNTAVVTGTPAVGLATPVTDTNPSHYFAPHFSLGNQVFADVNNNGMKDMSEVGLDGITLRLLNVNNYVLGTTTTAGGGFYRFNGLVAGQFKVEVVNPANYVSSTDIAGSSSPDNNIDNNDNGVTLVSGASRSGIITLGPSASEPTNEAPSNGQGGSDNQGNMTVDFGLYKLELGNQIWEEIFYNGVKDHGEPGIDGVSIALVDPATGAVLSTMVTDNGGYYTFTGFVSGTYVVRITAPLNYVSTLPDADGPNTDSDDNDDNGKGSDGGQIVSEPVSLTPGLTSRGSAVTNAMALTSNPNVDFGLYQLVPTPAICYSLILTHSGSGSNPVVSPSNSIGCPSGQYLANAQVSLTASPVGGWEVISWVGAISGNATTNNSLTMPAANHTVGVTYQAICYPLTVTHSGRGDDPVPSPANSSGCNPGSYVVGEIIRLTANPVIGWHTQGWSGTAQDTSMATSNSLTMPPTNHTAGVTYQAICYPLTVTHSGQGDEPVSSPANSSSCNPGTYVAGESINLIANPSSGWSVRSWLGTTRDNSSTPSNSLIMPAGPHSVGVTYQQDAGSEQPTQLFLSLAVNAPPLPLVTLRDGGFEAGQGWLQSPAGLIIVPCHTLSGSQLKNGCGGAMVAWLGGSRSVNTHILSQVIQMTTAYPVSLRFRYFIESERGGCDNGTAELWSSSNRLLKLPLCRTANSVWNQISVVLPSVEGVQDLRFVVQRPSGVISSFFVDDISLCSTSSYKHPGMPLCP